MENVSKALIMAGSVLIALMVISLLVYFYGDIKDLMGIHNKIEVSEQIEEFNKQYDVYYRNNLYGSDILSLINKVYDYNIREAKSEDYQKLKMQVTFNKNYIDYEGTVIISKKSIYNEDTLKSIADNLQEKTDYYAKKQVGQKKNTTISMVSGYRSNELEYYFSENEISEKQQEQINKDIAMYLSYKSMLSTVKSLKFEATDFEYDKNNGRIIQMVFRQN